MASAGRQRRPHCSGDHAWNRGTPDATRTGALVAELDPINWPPAPIGSDVGGVE